MVALDVFGGVKDDHHVGDDQPHDEDRPQDPGPLLQLGGPVGPLLLHGLGGGRRQEAGGRRQEAGGK